METLHLTDEPLGILPLSRLSDDLITMPLRNPNMTKDELETLAHGLNAVKGKLLTTTPSDANEVLAIISCVKASLNAITFKTEHESVEVIHHLVRQANAGLDSIVRLFEQFACSMDDLGLNKDGTLWQ